MTIQPRKDQVRLNDADNLNVDSAAVINDVVVKSLADLGILDPVATAIEPANPDDYCLWYNTQFQDHELLIWDPAAGNGAGSWTKPTRELMLLADEDILGAQDAIELLVNSDGFAHSDGSNAQEVLSDFDAALSALDSQERYIADVSLSGTTLTLTNNAGGALSQDLGSLSGDSYVFDMDTFPSGDNNWQSGMSFLVQDSTGVEKKQDLDGLVANVLDNGSQSSTAVAAQAFVSIDTAVAGDPVPSSIYLGSPLVYDIATGLIYTWNDTDADGIADSYQVMQVTSSGQRSGIELLATISANPTTGSYTKTTNVTLNYDAEVQFDYIFSGTQGPTSPIASVAMYFDNLLVASYSGSPQTTVTIGSGEGAYQVTTPAEDLDVDTDTILSSVQPAGTYEVKIDFVAPYEPISGHLRVTSF